MPLEDTAVADTATDAGSPGEEAAVATTENVETAPVSEISPDIQSKLDLLETYKSSHEFVDKFGGIESLQLKIDLDEAIRSGDPDRIDAAIAERNVQARLKLANKYGSAAAAPVDPAKILSEYLGPNVTNDTLREFRQWREGASRFENLPPEILYTDDGYGQKVLRADDDPVMILAKQVQEARQADASRIADLEQKLQKYTQGQQQTALQQETTAATNRIVEAAKVVAKTLGLSVAPDGETADARAVREYQLESFHSTAGLRFQNGKQTIDGRTQTGDAWIAELQAHIQRGEKVPARELEIKLSRKYRTVCDEVAKVVGQSWTGELQKKSTVTKKATDAPKGSKQAGQPLKTDQTLPIGPLGRTDTPEFEHFFLNHPRWQGKAEKAKEALAHMRLQAAD
jgi:hypothetical protein